MPHSVASRGRRPANNHRASGRQVDRDLEAGAQSAQRLREVKYFCRRGPVRQPPLPPSARHPVGPLHPRRVFEGCRMPSRPSAAGPSWATTAGTALRSAWQEVAGSPAGQQQPSSCGRDARGPTGFPIRLAPSRWRRPDSSTNKRMARLCFSATLAHPRISVHIIDVTAVKLSTGVQPFHSVSLGLLVNI